MYIVELIPLIAIALSVRCLQIIVNPPFGIRLFDGLRLIFLRLRAVLSLNPVCYLHYMNHTSAQSNRFYG